MFSMAPIWGPCHALIHGWLQLYVKDITKDIKYIHVFWQMHVTFLIFVYWAMGPHTHYQTDSLGVTNLRVMTSLGLPSPYPS